MGLRDFKHTLSRRLHQTLIGLLDGLAEKQLARRLGIRQNTAHVYVRSIYRLFEVDSRSSLMALFICPHKRWLVEQNHFTTEQIHDVLAPWAFRPTAVEPQPVERPLPAGAPAEDTTAEPNDAGPIPARAVRVIDTGPRHGVEVDLPGQRLTLVINVNTGPATKRPAARRAETHSASRRSAAKARPRRRAVSKLGKRRRKGPRD